MLWKLRRLGPVTVPLLLTLACGQDRGAPRPDAGATPPAPATGDAGATANDDGGAPSAATDAEPSPRLARPRRGTDGVRWDDPAAVAREALTRLRDSNLADVLVIATAENVHHRPPREPGQSAAVALFGESSWRARAVASWDGNLGETRVLGDEAWVAFEDLLDDRVAVVLLRRQRGQWRLHDLRSPSRARFGRFGASL